VSVVLLAVVLGDLVPDVWQDLAESGIPWWAAVLAAAFGFGALVTAGTGCGVRLGARIDACDGGRRTARRSLHEIFFCPGERTDEGPDEGSERCDGGAAGAGGGD
jgi:hypothetical protein